MVTEALGTLIVFGVYFFVLWFVDARCAGRRGRRLP
jgi:uncharacterized membrane protein YsdA (DUF1294 family)